MRYRAERAELRAGPRHAATLAGLDLRRVEERQNADAWAGSARVLDRDLLWSEDQRFDLVVPIGDARWVWRGVAVAWGDGAASLSGDGGPEVRG